MTFRERLFDLFDGRAAKAMWRDLLSAEKKLLECRIALNKIASMTTNNTGGRDKAMARVAKEALENE